MDLENLNTNRCFPNPHHRMAVVHLTIFEQPGPTLVCFVQSLIKKRVESRHAPFRTPRFL